MYKEYQIVMLSTDKANSNLFIHQGLGSKEKVLSSGQGIVHHKEMMACGVSQPQHLYILSDDNIQEGDWRMNFVLGIPTSIAKQKSSSYVGFIGRKPHSSDKKIIASTDKSLKYTDHRISPVPNFCDFSQIPQLFIEHYIQQYNLGNVIDKVLVKHLSYEDGNESTRMKYLMDNPLDVNSNNEITIKSNKN